MDGPLKVFLLVVTLLMPMVSLAADDPPILVDAETTAQKLDLNPHIKILVDEEKTLSLNDVINTTDESRFKSVAEIGNSFGFTTYAYWVRLSLHIDESFEDTLLLNYQYPLVDNLTIYIPDGKGGFTEKRTGDAHQFSTREIQHRVFLFTLPPHPGETRTYYLRLQSEGALQIPLSLWTPRTLVENIDSSNFVFGIYYGIMLLLMVFALAAFIKLRDKLFFFYFFYLLSYLLFQLSINGFSFQYLWPGLPEISSKANSALIGLVVIAGLLFSGSFLRIWDKKHPWVKILFLVLIIAALVGIGIGVFIDYAAGTQIVTVSGILLSPVVLVAGLSSLLSGYKPARYFLVAWAVFLVGVFIAGLLYLGFIPNNFITVYAIQIGSAFEVLLLGYALLGRINALRIEKEKAKARATKYLYQLNEELEALVGQRTHQLKEREAHLRTLIEALPDLVWLKDIEGKYLDCNSKFERYFGAKQKEIIGKTDYDFVDKTTADFYREKDNAALMTRKSCLNEEEVIYADDGHHELLETLKTPFFSSTGEVTGVLGVGRDITKRREAERALHRSQKMTALGQLTGGIAHDFNNILAIILGNLDLLEREGVEDENVNRRINTIKKASRRAADVVRQLLSFSRNNSAPAVVVNLNGLIMDMDDLIARSVTPQVEVKYELNEDLWLTQIDSGDFQDALLNLIINARDAMQDGGLLHLKTRNAVLDQSDSSAVFDVGAGDYVELSVVDDGEGILPEHQERLFEPFFTTKPQGKGTGLGLAMVYGFIERSGGQVKVESSPGNGSCFRMFLPRSFAEPSQLQNDATEMVDSLIENRKTVLAVDDEKELLLLTQDYLESLGLRVLIASSGAEALQLLAKEKSIELLFSDVLMPGGMNGYALAEQATKDNPSLKVILTSGYSSEIKDEEQQTEWGENLLHKPYKLAELAQRIRELLE